MTYIEVDKVLYCTFEQLGRQASVERQKALFGDDLLRTGDHTLVLSARDLHACLDEVHGVDECG